MSSYGWHSDPLTGKPPAGFSAGAPAYQVDERSDGVYVQLPPLRAEVCTVADVTVETLVAHGVTRVFGVVGPALLCVEQDAELL